ncbi:MAG: DUF4864 domain-containing protein [Inquilinus sp.]|nr:DUF4864 domain-containing protein [Inquilinus sp.]
MPSPRSLFLLFVLVFGQALPAAAQDNAPKADKSGIVKVIQGQLAAFQADRAADAFSYASPGIQAMFGTPDRFMEMVRGGYMPVYRPREVQFLDLVVEGGRLAQRVLLVGPDGLPVVAWYFMEKQADGAWRIDGVELRGSEDRTT